MRIVVILRQTPDTEAKIKVNEDGKTIDSNITWIMNPYDEFAVEKALKIKEEAGEGEVVVLSCGPTRTEEAIRQALAMGADRAVFIKNDSLENADPHLVSKLIASELKNLEYDLVISGKKLIDFESSQVPVFVAEELDLSYLTFVMKIEKVDKENKKLTCDREVEGAHEIVEISLPALITCDRGEDHPRYASITGIMKAKKKEVKLVEPSDDDINAIGKKTSVESIELPPSARESKIIEGETTEEKVQALVKALREDAKVL